MPLFSPFQYTSRTFEALLNDINSDSELVDKPNWWKRMIAGIGDVISMWNNALGNNLLLDTAYTRRNVQLLLELIDYTLTPQSTSSGILLFYLNGSVSFPVNISSDDLIAFTAGSTSISSKTFESRNSVNVSAFSETFVASDASDQLTVVREYTTGEKVRFSTTSALPSPLSSGVDYYVIKVDTTHIRIATSLLNAFNGTYIDITDTGTGTQTIHLYSFQVSCYQQKSKDQFIVGVSDGFSEWQEFDLSDFNVLQETLIVTINSVSWTRVDTFVNSLSTDKHFRIFYNDDNSSVIQFGNGIYGEIPGAFDIFVEYATGGGSDSNITTVNKINIYGGSDINILGVSNPSSFTGGANPQSISEAKILGPLLLKARDRFVTINDGEALCAAYPGISQATVIPNVYGLLSAQVVCIANGGGNPSTIIKSNLQQYLIDRTILEAIDVRVEDTVISAQNVVSAAKVLPTYDWSGQVEKWFRLGWKLFLSESGKEIKDDYDSNGVDSARELINIIFSESYTSSDNGQIESFLNAWDNDQVKYRTIGESDIQNSDVFAFLAGNTFGLDYMTISSPSFPLSLADDEITTYGSLTLTQIP